MNLILRAALLAAVAASAAVACGPRATEPSPTASTQSTAAATATPATTGVSSTASSQPATPGTITGEAGYPADGNPAMTIYAVSTTDRSVFFSVDVPRGAAPKPTYTIAGVRPGTYNLFAYQGDDQGPAGGAYTEYVKCGLRVTCSDHTPIDVTVRAGETVRGIDVNDWYATRGTFPSRPR